MVKTVASVWNNEQTSQETSNGSRNRVSEESAKKPWKYRKMNKAVLRKKEICTLIKEIN